MRIISGIYRGRRLKSPPKGAEIRPTLDRVKESLFNILQGKFEGATVLDLFCGTGSLGFEAMSRGAARTVFNDTDRDAVKLLRENLTALKAPEDSYKIYNYDFLTALRNIKNEKFDIIFLDPPYGRDLAADAVAKIDEYGLLAEGGVIVVEENEKKELKITGKKYIIKDKRVYGSVSLLFLGEEN